MSNENNNVAVVTENGSAAAESIQSSPPQPAEPNQSVEPTSAPAMAPDEPTSVLEPAIAEESISTPEPILTPKPALTTEPSPTPPSSPIPEATSIAPAASPLAAPEEGPLRPPRLGEAGSEVSEPHPENSGQESAPAPSPLPRLEPALPLIKNLLLKAKEKIQFRKRKKLARILELARQKGNIANQDVEKLLHLSDATATRYLSQLVKEGKLKRLGKPARARYEPL